MYTVGVELVDSHCGQPADIGTLFGFFPDCRPDCSLGGHDFRVQVEIKMKIVTTSRG